MRQNQAETIPPDPLSSSKYSGRQVAQNASRSLIGQIVPILVAIISIPLLKNRLGTERFGVLMLAWSFMGYFNLFDLGLGRTLTKNIAERMGSDQESEIPVLLWTTVAATALLGIIGGITLGELAPWLFSNVFNKIPLALQGETLDSLLIIAFCIPFVITTVPFRGVLEATQDFVTINKIQVPIGALFYLSPLLFSFISTSLPFVIFALVLCRLSSWFFFLIAALRGMPGPKQKIRIQLNLLPDLLKFGGWITVANIVKPILNNADRFMIGSMISISAVAYYATPYEITNRMWLLPWAIMSAVFPAFAYQARMAPEKAGALFTRAFKFMYVLLFPIAIFILLFAHEVLFIWMGVEYADHSSRVFQILAFATLLNCFSLVPEALLEAAGYPQVPGLLHLVQLPIYIVALYFVLPIYGLVGAGAIWIIHTSTDTLILSYFSLRFVRSIQIRWGAVARVTSYGLVIFAIVYFAPLSFVVRSVFSVGFCFVYPFLIWTKFFTKEERGFVLELLLRRYQKIETNLRTREKKIQKIGIALAAYQPNVEFFVAQLESIVAQSFSNWICVVTLDSPLSELRDERLQKFLSNPKFIWLENRERLGFKKNFEFAIRSVASYDADAIALCDQDDIWYPSKLEKLAIELDKLPLGSLVHSDMHVLSSDPVSEMIIPHLAPESAWRTEPRNVDDTLFVQLLLNNVVTGASCLFDVELAQKYGDIPSEFEFHDQWFAIAASLVGKIGAVEEPLYAYRQHGNNIVGSRAYGGMFELPASAKEGRLIDLAARGWNKVARRFQSIRQSPLGAFVSPGSLAFSENSVLRGSEFLLLSLLYRIDNPVLAREFMRKGVGKLVNSPRTENFGCAQQKPEIKKIGIALASYKPDPEFFLQQLSSIQKQTMSSWFCVIGCDSDLTELKKSAAFFPFVKDSRFIWVAHDSTKGAKKNFEFAIRECARIGCDAIACSDQDDIWYPEKLEVSRRMLQALPPLSLVHCDMHILLSNGATVEHYNDQNVRKLIENESSTVWVQERRGIQNVNPAHFLIRNVVAGAGMLMDTDLARMYPEVPAEIPYHDYWYAIVAAAHGGVYPVARALYQYRIHGENLAGVTPFKSVFSYTESIRQQGLWKKVADAFRFSKGNLRASVRERIPLGRLNQIVIGSRLDLGVGYFVWGLQHLKGDPAFARACFARALGKWVSLFVD